MIVPQLNGNPTELTKNSSNNPANFTIQGMIPFIIPARIMMEIIKTRTIFLKE